MKKSILSLMGLITVCGILSGVFFTVIVPTTHAEESKVASGADEKNRKILYWYDPMTPGTRFDKPGKSPFMDMDLVPKYADEVESDVFGKPVISMTAATIQKMGVRTEKVETGHFTAIIQATAIVAENERSRRDIFTQVEGRVEDLHYGAIGDPVKRGDLFYSLYSPELLSLQNDFLAAHRAGLRDLAQASKKRMELLGVDPTVITGILKKGKAFEKVPFYIPIDGVLDQLKIRNGSYLKINDEVGNIQDLSTLWLEADVPEKDMNAIKPGDVVEIDINAHQYSSRVDYIYPTIDNVTRLGKVRMVVDNTNGELRPASYARVVFATKAAVERLSVSSAAILQNSEGSHVIVALGDGKYQARDVKTGVTNTGRTEIIAGLHAGEYVVTRAQFLIDSESSLQESFKKLSGEQ